MHPPLAERMRPRDIEGFVGQTHILGEGQYLRNAILKDQVPSIIFWGPPGSGKTTLAHLIANHSNSHFVTLSAVLSGINEARKIMKQAEKDKENGLKTILFIDEIHRFNKAQQDAFLPFVESGSIVLIGATTENPSFEIIPPLLSRARVFVLKALTKEEIMILLTRAMEDQERGLGTLRDHVGIEEDALAWLAEYAQGDARIALTVLENAVEFALGELSTSVKDQRIGLTLPILQQGMQKKAVYISLYLQTQQWQAY